MKAIELKALSEEELRQKVTEFSNELFNLRFQKATGQLSNTSALLKTKRNIARVKTVLREREIESAKE